jgi:hypothetical protein
MDTHEARARRILAFAAELMASKPEELDAKLEPPKRASTLGVLSREEELPEQIPERPDVPELVTGSHRSNSG